MEIDQIPYWFQGVTFTKLMKVQHHAVKNVEASLEIVMERSPKLESGGGHEDRLISENCQRDTKASVTRLLIAVNAISEENCSEII